MRRIEVSGGCELVIKGKDGADLSIVSDESGSVRIISDERHMLDIKTPTAQTVTVCAVSTGVNQT